MNKTEYADYVASVKAFFEREGIQNLTGGHINCPDCGTEFEDEYCPKCGMERELVNEPFFSWMPCVCCGSHLGGDREHATGWDGKNVREYYCVCSDCIYFAEHGCLDDQTMLEVNDDNTESSD